MNLLWSMCEKHWKQNQQTLFKREQDKKSPLCTFIIAVFDINFRFDPHPPLKSEDWDNKLQRDGILKEDVNQSKYQDSVLW